MTAHTTDSPASAPGAPLEVVWRQGAGLLPVPAGFVAGFTTRELAPDGLSSSEGTRRLASALGISGFETVRLAQVHGRTVLDVEGPPIPGNHLLAGEADAVITNQRGRLLAVGSADCVPVVIADPRSGWIAAVHAGWRGTAARILDVVLDELAARGVSPGDLTAAFGPSISRDRYEVGPEVATALREAHRDVALPPSALTPGAGDRWFADVAACDLALLLHRGVPRSRIFVNALCTAGQPDLFPSYRRDGPKAGRIVTGIARV